MGAKSGLPPSILLYEDFWKKLHQAIAVWAGETIEGSVPESVESRRIHYGTGLTEILQDKTAFFFNAKMSPGLCAIAIDNEGTSRIIAKRLQQDIESARDTSALFRKLMFEAPAVTLWRIIGRSLQNHAVANPASPICDPAQAVGGIASASRYLAIVYRIMPEAVMSHIWVVFDPDYLTERAHEALANVAEQKKKAPSRMLHESALGSSINVDAVLDQISMTIGDCSRLKIGDLIPLLDPDPGTIRLKAETVNGQIEVGRGEMGVWKRHRALKIKQPMLDAWPPRAEA